MNKNNLALFTNAGLALVPIAPIGGKPTKAPHTKGWNMPKAEDNPDGYSVNLDDFKNTDGFNFGLYHGASNTLALDLDDVELARKVFDELTDLELSDWLESDLRVEVKSPKANRGKLLFKLPVNFAGAGLRQLKHDNKSVFELRSGNCQDVIHGQHPEGGAYQFVGDPAAIPEAPAVLLDMLQHWDTWKPCLDSALGIEPEPSKIATEHQQLGEQLPGRYDPIQEFNQSFSVVNILNRNGYKSIVRDRFIRPGSESKAPGVAIMRNCADGIERIYSHGSDVLNDGYAHDAFDCYRLLECDGDWAKAFQWDQAANKQQQREWANEQAKCRIKENATKTDDAEKLPPIGLLQWDVATRYVGQPPPRAWLVEDVLLMGKAALLAAAGGVGKSFLLLSLAYKVATYHTLSIQSQFTSFGKLARGGAAVVICAEDDAIEIHNRLTGMGGLPAEGQLIVVSLPDAGGARPLFEINPQSRAPVTAQAFHNLHHQLKAIPNLAFVALDPLQALCGGLDLNLPQHSQHVCAALAHLAADTGAAVIVSHHLRKGGDIKTPEEAREAIRGSSGLVDGVRSALALWPDNMDESKTVCKRLSVDWQQNRVCKLAVVKANFKADLHVKTLVRTDDGLLEDRSFDLYSVTPKADDLIDKLLDDIEQAAVDGRPFTKTGQSGVYDRREELSSIFHSYGKNRLQELVRELLNNKRLTTFKLSGHGKTGCVWLGKPTGILAVSQSIGGDIHHEEATKKAN